MLIHFPIALVVGAALAEVAAIGGAGERWRAVAIANLRCGALLALFAAIAGWQLASDPGVEMSSVLEWHRWFGVAASALTVIAAGTAPGLRRRARSEWLYRTALFMAAALVALAGHLGGLLVWGTNFLHL